MKQTYILILLHVLTLIIINQTFNSKRTLQLLLHVLVQLTVPLLVHGSLW